MELVLPSKHNSCIFCGKRFLSKGFLPDETVSFGPVQRSKEHIIPENLFGRIITRDICKPCNDRFGEHVDIHPLRDRRVILTAEQVGVSKEDLLSKLGELRGFQQIESGEDIPVTFKKGTIRAEPRLKNSNKLAISVFDGEIRPQDLVNLKRSLIQKIKRKRGLSELPADMRQEIEWLCKQLDVEPDKDHSSEALQEGFRPVFFSGPANFSIQEYPWKTDRCIAKIVAETLAVGLPTDWWKYSKSIFLYLHRFIQMGLKTDDPESERTIFAFDHCPAIGAVHQIDIKLTKQSFSASVVLFGSAKWPLLSNLQPMNAPDDNGWQITLKNPLDPRDEPSISGEEIP